MSSVIDAAGRRKLHEKVLGLKRAGKSDREIAEILAISPSTIKYLAAYFVAAGKAESPLSGVGLQKRLQLAHELRQAGKGFAEIGELLQVSTNRARQMIHRYAWNMRHTEPQGAHKQ
jgi:orotate phosphoribosyltransferase-like protein